MKVKMYTDGACSGNPGPGGWAVVVNDPDGCNQFSGGEAITTNNRMELFAVVRCLRIILDRNNRGDQFEIYSDSAYVVNAINNGWIENWKSNGWLTKQRCRVKNKDLWELVALYLDELTNRGTKVTIAKIKGHAGNTFNELCDKLAKKAAERASCGK